MEEEQLNEAYSKFAKANKVLIGNNGPLLFDAFEAGARWHESLPLAEKLTEWEQNNFRAIHSITKDWSEKDKVEKYQLESICKSLEYLFGKDFFTVKSE